MPNEPKPAAKKRTRPIQRPNAQDDNEGSPHDPSEFDVMNPAKLDLDRDKAGEK